MYKRLLSIILVLIMLLGLIPGFTIPAFAASGDDDISDMNALDALGIDTSAAPKGYDANSTENPYGTDVVSLGTVWELYTVGLMNKAAYSSPNASNTTGTHDADAGGNLNNHTESNQNANTLQSNLYGSADASYPKVSDVLGSKITTGVASGTTTQTANYVRVGNGVNGSSVNNGTGGNYMTSVSGRSTSLTNAAAGGDTFSYALSSVASGNFNGNTASKQSQTVMAYTTDCTANGGLSLRFGDADGNYGASSKELISTAEKIGNPTLTDVDGKLVEDFVANPYQLKNYLQVATGDWDSNGVDEVAVYVPEYGYSRILVYKFGGLDTDKDANGLYTSAAYTNTGKWTLAWSYYFNEGNVVSNMVSFTTGDVNQDGVDDLAATWGYYYGIDQNKGSRAVVMFGGSEKTMLRSSQEFNLTYGSSNIVRASFAYGDLAGSGEACLILSGQSDSDLKAGNLNTRYVALYNWSGTQFTSNVYKNFDLFSTNSSGSLIYGAMTRAKVEGKYIFYSSPLCVSNTAVVSQGVTQKTSVLYFDSLLIKYTDSGLDIAEAWDNTASMQPDTLQLASYVEYDAVGGDLTGQTGAGMVATMQQTIGNTTEKTAPYLASGLVPYYQQGWYYNNWWYRMWGWRTYYWYFAGRHEVNTWTSDTVAVYTPGKTYMVVVSPNEDTAAHYIGEASIVSKYSRAETDVSMTICLANTDSDTSYMKYGGNHYFLYTDPEVLAALASPPYFSDLLNRDDLSGNYAESTTSYSSTTGSGGGSTSSATLTVGAYVSFEHDFEVFGVKVASVEAEATVTAGFTWDTEKTSTLEQTITYNATSGEDMIAFYSIPMEVFEYITYTPAGGGDYTKVVTTVNIPHEAAVRLLSLEEYEMIAADYDVLPKISDTVMTHTVGDPTLYPKSSEIVSNKYHGYDLIAQYGGTNGTPSAVGYSSTGGGASVTQEIAMSKQTQSAFTVSGGLDMKAGAGVGDFKVGIVAGVQGGAGKVTITTDGSSFSGDMQNMPIEAQKFGYAMNWRIFAYAYKAGSTSFPVVSYLVSDITMPPTLPADFDQSVAATTDTAATLTFTYDKAVAAFWIYRYYEFPEGTGSYLIATVPFSAATGYDVATGTYSFSYTEHNLSPYTEYQYQIQTVGIGTQNNKSIYSEPITVSTKTAVGYPDITVSGLDDGKLLLYPDTPSSVSVTADMKPEDEARDGEYKSTSYQWQRINNEGNWADIQGAWTNSYEFKNTSASDATSYRCRLNIVYYDGTSAREYLISAYSQAFTTAYSKRTSTGDMAVTVSGNTLTAKAQLWSANTNHSTAPTGTITVTVNGVLSDNTIYEYSKTVALASDGTQNKNGETKNIYAGTLTLTGLKSGVYMVSYTYSGNRYFKSHTLGDSEVGIVGSGSTYQLGLADSNEADAKSQVAFTYGDSIYPTMSFIAKNAGGDATKASIANPALAYSADGSAWTAFTPGGITPSVGTYTMRATYDVVNTATQTFTVTPRDITVEMPTYSNISAGNVPSTQPVAQLAAGSTMAAGETFAMDTDSVNNTTAALRLGYLAFNSAGTQMALDASTNPGNYSVIGCKSSSSSPAQSASYENYNITYVPGVYTIIGATYLVTVIAANYTDLDGSRVVGTANINNGGSIDYYPSGSSVTLVADPDTGYSVKKWTVHFQDDSEKYNDATHKPYGGAEDLTSLYLTTEAQNATVTVTFERANYTLTTSVSGGGTVSCSDSNFTNASYAYTGGEFAFTATPSAGYHFSKWIVYADTTSHPTGIDNGNGTSTLHFTMGTANTAVQAVFVRDSYTLTLDGNIRAWYMKPGQTTTAPAVKTYITSGGSVSGSSEITVEPKLGYAKNGSWTVGGSVIDASDSTYTLTGSACKFSFVASTAISLATTQGSFDVSASADHGSVAIAVDGTAKEGTPVSAVSGGSQVTFTAKAHRGYVFDHWTVGGAALADLTALEKENITASTNADASALLTIAELDAEKAVAAVFAPNSAYTFTASLNNASRGTLTYTLKDIYGEVATENGTYASVLTVYQGESVRLTVTPASGNMVEHWVINGAASASTDKYKDFNNLTANMTVEVQLKATTGYRVVYSVGSNGNIVSAKADGHNFDSGSILSGGAETVLTASPNSGYMLEKWTRIVGLNSEDEVVVTDADGVNLVDPVYTTFLNGHYQYKAYFTALLTHTVSTAAITGGTGVITYATPPTADSNGTVNNATSYAVRDGGTVKIKFTASDGYATDAVYLKAALSACGQVVNITETIWGKEYVAEIKGVSGAQTISSRNPFYELYDVSLAAVTNGSVSITSATPSAPSDYYLWTATAASVRSGAVVTLTFTPDTGCEVDSVTASGESVTVSGANVTPSYVDVETSDTMTGSLHTVDYSTGVSDRNVTVAVTYKAITPCPTVTCGPLLKSGADSGHGSVEAQVSRKGMPAYAQTITSASSVNVYRNGQVVLHATPETGYKFASWTVDGTEYDATAAPAGVTVNGIHLTLAVTSASNASYDIKALFELAGDKVNFSAENYDAGDATIRGTVSAYSGATAAAFVSGSKLAVSSTLTFTAVPDTGYHVEGWYKDGTLVSGASVNTYSYTYDVTQGNPGADIAVKFIRDSYTVTYSAASGAIEKSGTEATGSEQIIGDTVVTLTAVPDEGYAFVRWTVNGQSAGEDTTLNVTVTANTAIAAIFEPHSVTYTVTYSAGSNGTLQAVNGSQQSIPSGAARAAESAVVFTATPGTGYQVKCWVVNDTELVSEQTSYTIDSLLADATVSVEFKAIPTYTITLSPYTHGTVTAKVDGADRALVSGVLTVSSHENVVLTAKPSAHYAFVGWGGDGSGTDTALTINNVTDNKSISASFTAAEYIHLTVSKEDSDGNITLVKTVSDGEEKNVTATVGTEIEIVAGSTVTIEATPNSGKMVKSWKINDSTTANLSKTEVRTNLLSDTTVKVAFEDYVDWTIPTGSSSTFFTATTISRTPDDATPVTGIRDRGTVTFKLGINANYVLTSLKVNGLECMVSTTTDYGSVSVTPNSDGTCNVTVTNVMAAIDVTATEYKLQPSQDDSNTHPELTAAAENRLSGQVQTNLYDVSMMSKNGDGDWEALDSEDAVDDIISARGSVDLYLPYPADITYASSEGYEFSVAHLITTGANAGTIEYLTATPTPEGLRVTITSMSPFALSYAPTYKITFNANGGSCSTAHLFTGSNAKLSSMPVASKDGSSFNGWYTDLYGGTQITTSTVFAGSSEVYAQFTVISDSGGGVVGGGGGIVAPKADYIKTTVSGVSYDIGAENTTDSATVLTVDQEKFGILLSGIARGASIVLPVSSGKDTSIVSLTVGNMESLAAKNAVLTVSADSVSYRLDPKGIDTAAILKMAGATDSHQIALEISIARSNAATQSAARKAIEADGATIVVEPIEFTITATYEDKTYSITTYSTFMTRSIEVTAAQAARITTAIVYRTDGTSYHAPTKVRTETIDGVTHYFADIASLHDSTYVLINQEKSFTDVAESWYKNIVNEMASREIIDGKSDGMFHGGDYITRAEFAAVVVRALGLESLKSTAADIFSDVSSSAWYYNDVGLAYEYGVVSGTTAATFNAAANITREDAMLMIQRACSIVQLTEGTKDYSGNTGINEASTYAKDAVVFNLKTGLIEGNSAGYVNAGGNITRAETATVVLRMMQMSGMFNVISQT